MRIVPTTNCGVVPVVAAALWLSATAVFSQRMAPAAAPAEVSQQADAKTEESAAAPKSGRLRKEINRETAAEIFRGRAGYFERLPPRPVRSPEERAAHAAKLREVYSKSPADWPQPLVDKSVEWQELGALPEVTIVDPKSIDGKRIELGKRLFFDPRLSSSRQIACASCHDPDLAWGDGRTVAFGHERKALKRNAPSIMNVADGEAYFWDGRAASLEDQARQVLHNPDEMHSSDELILERLNQIPEYLEAFAAAYPDETFGIDLVCTAIADFERSIVGGRSRFDAFLRGNHKAMGDDALVGLDLFRREAGCMNCHHGPKFTDGQTHNVGLSYYGRPFQDLGKFEHTRQFEDVGAFKTPSLRNVSRTGPYMHNGLFPSVRGVLNMYNAGMPTLVPRNRAQLDDPFFPKKSHLLKPLGLNPQDLTDLEAFLKTLEEPALRVREPARYAEASKNPEALAAE